MRTDGQVVELTAQPVSVEGRCTAHSYTNEPGCETNEDGQCKVCAFELEMVKLTAWRAGADEARKDERAKIVAWLRAWADEREVVIRDIPEGAACRGGPFDGVPEFDLAMKTVRAARELMEDIERGEHLK